MIAGPNGVGKTTSAMMLLPEVLHFCEYVNADSIAVGLSPFKPEDAAFKAGRLMLERIHFLAAQKTNFAFETTGASKRFFPFLKKCKQSNFEVNVLFLWNNSVDISLKRIADRVERGGHGIPENIVRRRYKKCLQNFFNLYSKIATSWFFYDNSEKYPKLLAAKYKGKKIVFNNLLWDIYKKVHYGNKKA